MDGIRISNMSRKELHDLWRVLDSETVNKVILTSNSKEISYLFGQTPEKGVQVLLEALGPEAAEKLFSSLSSSGVNRILLLATSRFITRLPKLITMKTLFSMLKSLNADVRDRIIKSLPLDDQKMVSELFEEKSEISDNYKTYLTEKFENSLELDSFARIKEIEEKERFLERRQRAREEQLLEQFEALRTQIAQTEKDLHNRQTKFKNIELSYARKEQELKENIRALQEEHQKQVQEKIEIKVPEFVKSAIGALESKEKEFAKKSTLWNVQGGVALGLSIVASIVALAYGGFAFNDAAKSNIDWFFFSFLLIKGLVVVTLFAAWAKHAFNIGNAYMHESLKRLDRMHAINFGKLYLEVYGNDVSQADMKSIFENWNLDSDSAFTKVAQTSFEPKILEQVSQIITAASNAAGKAKIEGKQA
jgi:hypothetical protein